MRRIALALILLAVALAWVIPASAARSSASAPSYSAVRGAKHAAVKKKRTPTPVPHRHKHKKKKPTKKKPMPKPTARHKRTPTPRPKATKTPLPVILPSRTPTSTATLVPTATLTPTPVPQTASLALKSQAAVGYSAGFYVCGLPAGVTATFQPNPADSAHDETSPSYGSAQTTVTVSVPYTVAPTTYGLTFYAFYRDSAGVVHRAVPDGTVSPQFAVLTVAPDHASLQAAAGVPPDSGLNCSGIPRGYEPAPLPTTGPSDYSLTTWVSDAHPVLGETETVYARLTYLGQPVAYASVNFAWYSYGITRSPCYVLTDKTGTASCSAVNSTPLAGVPVTIEASVYYNGFTFNGWTSYTM